MASTYTPNLNLEKPGHGERVNDWDACLNANFDAIDAAAWLVPVRTDDPDSPAEGEQWVRSDLAQLRIRVSETTYKVDLTAV
ncbi:MAG TPA: hypothetical protein VM219_06400 [Phycisphaerae bacterium]|nr:hypothetical protein [Phycisphaerae bacterium]